MAVSKSSASSRLPGTESPALPPREVIKVAKHPRHGYERRAAFRALTTRPGLVGPVLDGLRYYIEGRLAEELERFPDRGLPGAVQALEEALPHCFVGPRVARDMKADLLGLDLIGRKRRPRSASGGRHGVRKNALLEEAKTWMT
jgi:hypothetical protein